MILQLGSSLKFKQISCNSSIKISCELSALTLAHLYDSKSMAKHKTWGLGVIKYNKTEVLNGDKWYRYSGGGFEFMQSFYCAFEDIFF